MDVGRTAVAARRVGLLGVTVRIVTAGLRARAPNGPTGMGGRETLTPDKSLGTASNQLPITVMRARHGR